ncbi:hypothetical protein [Phytomonospora endophytica]|uniref:Uncharacterized protein n=1 Tax=Phytomonospora endophytica TaxID=714109 RepID=A0A841FY76_9ACTN|nr:hypothetical protein [Phytomonospora endophytica]MBB6036920.1 hypothetical protein [Phytomonospora endophytica]GIG68048.1 hypothetical protein Pen01_43430 [Phytomonospora endophytica]
MDDIGDVRRAIEHAVESLPDRLLDASRDRIEEVRSRMLAIFGQSVNQHGESAVGRLDRAITHLDEAGSAFALVRECRDGYLSRL